MLVLTAKAKERIFLTLPDGRVGAVTLIRTRGSNIQIGFDLPADVNIRREHAKEKHRGKRIS